MQVSVEATEGLERKLKIEVPAERIDSAVTQRLQSLSKTVRMHGFRPGKVPMKVVRTRFGDQVRQEVMGEVIQSSFQDAVLQEKLRPAGLPTIEPVEINAGEPFAYTAVFEVYPELELAPVDGLTIEKPIAVVSDADIDDMIDSLRKQRLEWEDVERAAEDGDQLTIDFVGRIDGEEFAGGKADNVPLVLGSGSMIAGFEDQLLGASTGDQKIIAVSFPDDYRAEHLAGKAAEFDVKVHAVKASKLPEIDDEFAMAFGVEEGGVEALRDDIRRNMTRELEQAISGRIKQQVMDGLVELNQIDLPKALVTEEIARLRQNVAGQMPEGASSAHLTDELFAGDAERRVRLGLIIAEIIRSAELKADQDKVREFVENLAASYQEPQQVVDYYYSNRELLQNVEGLVLEQAVTDWVIGQAQVAEAQKTFKEVMNPVPSTEQAGE
jgi:trigger factor